MASSENVKISCQHVWKIYGPRAKAVHKALAAGKLKENAPESSRHVLAVKNVSFEVQAGEIFVIMGLSGSGKSTLLRCVSRLIEPTSGEIRIDGRDVMKMDKAQLRNLRRHTISMVFQRFGLFPHRRIVENVAYGLEVQGVEKNGRIDKARTMLELVGLKGWEQRYPHELSGGMQQRVGLARALAVDPQILLCDEPFSALDPLIRREMQDELIRLQKVFHKTIIFVTHNFLEALKLGDHIAIMKDGEIVQKDTPEQIVAHPANDYVREFTADVPRNKVLTARAIMKAADATSHFAVTVPGATKLENLIPIVAATDGPVGVVEGEAVVGMVDRTAVMLALVEE